MLLGCRSCRAQYPCSHVTVPLPALVPQASVFHLWFPLARILEYFGTAPSFELAVLVLLILASSQPCSTSEDQKAVPDPRAVPKQCWAVGFGSAGAQLVSASQQSSRNCFIFFVCLVFLFIHHSVPCVSLSTRSCCWLGYGPCNPQKQLWVQQWEGTGMESPGRRRHKKVPQLRPALSVETVQPSGVSLADNGMQGDLGKGTHLEITSVL